MKMAKSRKGLLVVIISLLVVLAMTILYGCGDNKGGENCTISGHGSIVENIDKDGIVSYTAVADKWNVFSGWYDGVDKYSDSKTIIVDNKTPDNLVAKFDTSGMLSINRILNGAYQRYSEAVASGEKYLNMSYEGDLSIQGDTNYSSLEVERGGYISLEGQGYNDYATVKRGQQVLFSSYYTDDSQQAMLYIEIDGRKIAIDDFASIGKKLFTIPTLSTEAWSLQNLLKNSVYNLVDSLVGIRNAVGFIKGVENAPSQTKITFDVDSLLNNLKNRLSTMTDPDLKEIKEVVEMLTNQYEGISNNLPAITIDLVVDYKTIQGIEKVDSLSINANFGDDYKFDLDGDLIEIPSCTMSLKLSNANFSLSSTPNAVPQEIISSFPEALNAINVRSQGSLYFLKENVATLELGIIDEYDIEFASDINYASIERAVSNGNIDLSKVDWGKFGFLSFSIKLVENPEDSKQSSRHNGSTEYLNILIDTERFGTNAFVYVDLYNPETWSGFATSTYIINATYDIPELVRLLPQIKEKLSIFDEENSPETASFEREEEKLTLNIISQSILCALCMQFSDLSDDQILYDLFMSIAKTFAPNNNLIQDGMSYSEFGTTLAVEEIKELIEKEFNAEENALSNLGLQNNIFGKTTTHIAIKAKGGKYGAVCKNDKGEYVDDENNSYVEIYNNSHKMLLAVADDVKIGFESLTYTKQDIENEVSSLKGKDVTIERALFSDGSESETFVNCQGNNAQIDMKVFSSNYVVIDDTSAQINVYLSFGAGTLQGLMVNTYELPYGLIKYTFTVNLV